MVTDIPPAEQFSLLYTNFHTLSVDVRTLLVSHPLLLAAVIVATHSYVANS